MKQSLVTKEAPAAIGPYSQGIRSGEWVFVSGQLGVDPQTGEFAADDAAGQAAQALRNVQAVLVAGDMGLESVVKVTVYLADLGDFSAVNQVYAEVFSAPFPARACIEAAALPKGAKVEIDAIACC